MKQIFLLSKKDMELSKEEVLRLYGVKEYESASNLLIIDTGKDYSSRLAYTKEVYEFLFECREEESEEIMRDFDWDRIYEGSFSLEINNKKSLDERKLSGIIWEKLKNPKVDLSSPKTRIVLFNTGQRVFCGKLKAVADKSFLKRKPHLRPSLHPTSLDPQLARACVNLTGKTKGSILDPFCGSGGILIEAGLIGFKILGHDIDRIMINRSRINLRHYGIKDYKLEIKDAAGIFGGVDCIVTDLPYGRASRVNGEPRSLYKRFLMRAYDATGTAVVLFPDFVDPKKLVGRWHVEKEFTYYLHKNLSKKILLLTH